MLAKDLHWVRGSKEETIYYLKYAGFLVCFGFNYFFKHRSKFYAELSLASSAVILELTELEYLSLMIVQWMEKIAIWTR